MVTPEAPVCRLLIEAEATSGVWNMAVDEVLLESALDRDICTLRLYRWATATVSLGYFQNRDEAAADVRLRGLPVVRRLSGGGAILHHHELTYSCAVPASHALARRPRDLYEIVHQRVIEELAGYGYLSRLRGAGESEKGSAFLCFARGDAFDVVMGAGHKVLGSAQRRRKGAILQHGSLLLRRSEHTPEFPGVFDCAGFEVEAGGLAARLAVALAGLFGRTAEDSFLTAGEGAQAARRCHRREADCR